MFIYNQILPEAPQTNLEQIIPFVALWEPPSLPRPGITWHILESCQAAINQPPPCGNGISSGLGNAVPLHNRAVFRKPHADTNHKNKKGKQKQYQVPLQREQILASPAYHLTIVLEW